MQTFAILINYFTTNKQLYLNFLALPLKTNVKHSYYQFETK